MSRAAFPHVIALALVSLCACGTNKVAADAVSPRHGGAASLASSAAPAPAAPVQLASVACPGGAPLQHRLTAEGKVLFWCGDPRRGEWLIGESSPGGTVRLELHYRESAPGAWTGTLRRRQDHDWSNVELANGQPSRCELLQRTTPGQPDPLVQEERLWQAGAVRLSRRFHEGRLVEEEELDEKGARHGVRKLYWSPGQPMVIETYEHGVPHGPERRYRKNGSKSTERWLSHGRRHGPFAAWDDQERKRLEGTYEDGEPHGTFTAWDEQGKVTDSLKMEHGAGLFIELDEDAHVQRRGYRQAGAWHGPFTDFGPSGKVRASGRHRDGTLDGRWTLYHESGQPKLRGRWLLGIPAGEWELLHENGTAAARGELRSLNDGSRRTVRHGLWKEWSSDGKLQREETYESGVPASPAARAGCHREVVSITTAGGMAYGREEIACPPKLTVAQ